MSRIDVEELEVHGDERGWVFEPLSGEELASQRNAHVVWSRPGAVRGNHFHRRGEEWMAVAGPALVRVREEGDEPRDIPVPDGSVYRFTFPPGVAHAVLNTGDAPNLLVAFRPEEHDPEDPDVVRDVLIPAEEAEAGGAAPDADDGREDDGEERP